MAKVATAPRKMPRQERSRAMVETILAATARVLTREGFDKLSTNRVAEVAGVSVGSLYQYFPSKEALVAALVERHAEEMLAVLRGLVASAGAAPVEEATRAVVKALVEAHAVAPRLHRVIMEQVPRTGRLGRLHGVEDEVMKMVRGYLEAHRDELAVPDLDTAAFVAVTAVEGLTHSAVIYAPERLCDELLIDEIVRLVVGDLTGGRIAARRKRARRATRARRRRRSRAGRWRGGRRPRARGGRAGCSGAGACRDARRGARRGGRARGRRPRRER